MIFDSSYSGSQGVTREDRAYDGSTFSEIRQALFANAYYLTWRGPDEPPLPIYSVTLRRALMGVLPRGLPWGFQEAARRTVEAPADLRWGRERRGFRRIVHPNGVCLMGLWEIDDSPAARNYTGYFKPGSKALIIARYSVCCTETRRGRYRSLSMVGKIFPTTDPNHQDRVRTANFITQEDFGGSKTTDISQAELRNAPDTTPWRRGAGIFTFLVTGLVLIRADKEPTIRQLHEIAELGKPAGDRTNAPEFMRLLAEAPARAMEGADLDFRDEILGRIYDPGNPAPQRTLTFHIEVSDVGRTRGRLVQRRTITDWKRIGRIVFHEGVASYNGDFVIHFHHPVWRNDRNDPNTVARKRLRR